MFWKCGNRRICLLRFAVDTPVAYFVARDAVERHVVVDDVDYDADDEDWLVEYQTLHRQNLVYEMSETRIWAN